MAEMTAREQLILELVNRARMDPAGEAARHGIDLNKDLAAGTITAAPKQVLAGNGFLNSSADGHSNWMLQQDVFSHTGANNSSAGDRMKAAGYVFSGAWTWGENIAWSGTTGTLDADAAAAQHHVNLFKSAGHRVNILNDSFRELGVGSLTGQFTANGTAYNAQMTTQNFAKSGSNVFVTGVSYADANGDQFYSIGEGKAGRMVQLWKDGAVVLSGQTAGAGGYALGTTVSGDVEVRFSGGGLSAAAGALVNLGSSNVKVDLVGNATIFSNVSATLTQKASGLTLIGIGNISGTGNGLGNVITGNAGANTLDGAAGADRLFGNGGADNLLGGGGKDKLQGGLGSDTLSGNAGADTFIFKTLAEVSGDRITDFAVGSDKIDLSGIDAVAGGADNAFAFGGQAFAGAGSVRFVQGSGETSVEIDMTGNGAADYVLKLAGLHTLHATDFIL